LITVPIAATFPRQLTPLRRTVSSSAASTSEKVLLVAE